MPSTWPPRSILITGASSGIGAALARRLAAHRPRLALIGRDQTRLDEVVAACRAQGADAHATSADVRDRAAMERAVLAADDAAALDLVIANAGMSGGGDTRRIVDVNVGGTINTIEPALERMRARRAGQIALMSSMAGFRGMPSAPAYCASKAMVRVWGEALRGRLRDQGVTVSVICPGFVETPLTAENPFSMPFIMTAERAAARILGGIERKDALIIFPRRLYWLIRLLQVLPPSLADAMLSRAASKEG